MGMYAKLRHVSAAELDSAKKDSAKFYRDLVGITGAGVDQNAMMLDLTKQMSDALVASPYGKEFTNLPEAQRVAAATRAGKVPEAADQQALMLKMMEFLPKINFTPNLSALTENASLRQDVAGALELEKSWHCIHHMLTGEVWETGAQPIGYAILGGTEIPDSESVMSYGPARYLSEEEVKEVAAALAEFPIKQKAAAFDQKAAAEAEIYCPNYDAEELEYYFGLLKNYFHKAAQMNHGMLMWIE